MSGDAGVRGGGALLASGVGVSKDYMAGIEDFPV